MVADQVERPFDILLVEDNPGDVRLTREALMESGVPHTLAVAENGDVAMSMLRREGEHADKSRPDLILLDLGLPGTDGRRVLADIKADTDLKRIPVIVLTLSRDEFDILLSYNLLVENYLTKPINVVKLKEALETERRFKT